MVLVTIRHDGFKLGLGDDGRPWPMSILSLFDAVPGPLSELTVGQFLSVSCRLEMFYKQYQPCLAGAELVCPGAVLLAVSVRLD